MDSTNSQLLNSVLDGSQQTSNPTDMLSGMQTQLTWLLWLGGIASIVLTIAFIAYIIYKMRVQSAILHIDKNLQKLVDAQAPATQQVPVEPVSATRDDAIISADTDIEQK